MMENNDSSNIILSKNSRIAFRILGYVIILIFVILFLYSFSWDWEIGEVKTLHTEGMTYRFDHTSSVNWLKWIFYPFIVVGVLFGAFFVKAGEEPKNEK